MLSGDTQPVIPLATDHSPLGARDGILPPDSLPTTLGIVLIAHGSRRSEANAELLTIVSELQTDGIERVSPAYLELADPSIVAAGCRAAECGWNPIVLLPYFLSAGRHVVDDLAAARDELTRRFPAIRFVLAGPLGPHPLLVEILRQRIAQSVAPHE